MLENTINIINDFGKYVESERKSLSEFRQAHEAYNMSLQNTIAQISVARASYSKQIFETKKREIANNLATMLLKYTVETNLLIPEIKENFTKKIAALECAMNTYEIKSLTQWFISILLPHFYSSITSIKEIISNLQKGNGGLQTVPAITQRLKDSVQEVIHIHELFIEEMQRQLVIVKQLTENIEGFMNS